MQNSNLWKVISVSIPSWTSCPIENGYAVAHIKPYVLDIGTTRERAGYIVVQLYSGYCLQHHALSQCNTLNLAGISKDDRVLRELSDLILVNRDFICDAV